MNQSLTQITLVVNDYDEAIEYYTKKLNFVLVEDRPIPEQNKRWVVISPAGSEGATILLAKAANERQKNAVGNQTGGRVFLFLNTDDFWRDYNSMLEKGIVFKEKPRNEPFGTVVVFEDLYGNLWDFIEKKEF